MRVNLVSSALTRMALFISIMGPGIITALVDNDAGGIATYSIAGSHFGLTMLWTLVPMTVVLIVVQEMAARMGVVTGKGLADLIRENYGVRATFYIMVAVLVANIGTTMSEFAGIAMSLEIFGVSKFVSVPIAAFLVWQLVTRWPYKSVEKVFLASVIFFASYIISGVLARPQWPVVLKELVWPTGVSWSRDYMFVLIGLVGTTITPWMQFYLQSSVVEKGIRKEEYRFCRWDVIAGCSMTNVITFFIIMTCAVTLHVKGITVQGAAEAALALAPIAGHYCSVLFAFGLLNASLAAAAILPLTTAFYVCEGLGWEAGVDRTFEEAPQFYSLYGASIVLGAGAILWPHFPLWRVMLLSQVIQGILLPFILLYMLRLINKRELMGDFVNSRTYNAITWVTVIFMIGLTLTMVLSTISLQF